MCLTVWLGTERPVSQWIGATDPTELGSAGIEPVDEGHEVRRNLPSPYVAYIGSHQGCGCGFNSGLLDFEGLEEESELRPLLDGLLDDERIEYLAERRSRERLYALIGSALSDGPVIVHVCWAGAEREPPVAEETVDATWLLRKTAPLKEGTRYTVTSGRPAAAHETSGKPNAILR